MHSFPFRTLAVEARNQEAQVSSRPVPPIIIPAGCKPYTKTYIVTVFIVYYTITVTFRIRAHQLALLHDIDDHPIGSLSSSILLSHRHFVYKHNLLLLHHSIIFHSSDSFVAFVIPTLRIRAKFFSRAQYHISHLRFARIFSYPITPYQNTTWYSSLTVSHRTLPAQLFRLSHQHTIS